MNADSNSRDRKTPAQPAAQDVVSLTGKPLAWTLSGFMLAMILSILNQTSLATAMPRIIAELGGFDRYAWPSSAYLLAAAISVPFAGRLSGLYGRKLLLMLGLGVFMLGSLLAGMSGSMTQLIAFRGLQGLGGGIIVVSCFVAIIDLFPPEKRGRIQGLAALVFVMAAVTGPPLGGFITDVLSWNWVLLINIPAGILILLLVMKQRYPRLNTDRNAPVPDYLGMYRNRTVAASVALNFLAGFGLYGTALFAPLFLQMVLGATATGSGGVLMPMVLGIVIGGILSALVLTLIKAGYRTNAVLSAVVLSVGMYLVATLDQESGLGQAMAFLAVVGLGIGGGLATANVAVWHFVPNAMQTITASTIQFFRFLSGALGLAFLGSVLNMRFSARLDGMMPETLRNALDPDMLDRIKQNLRILVDPAAARDLVADAAAETDDGARMAEGGAGARTAEGGAGAGMAERDDGARMAEQLVDVLNGALVGAVQDVFMVGMAVTAFAILAGLFLKNAATGNDA